MILRTSPFQESNFTSVFLLFALCLPLVSALPLQHPSSNADISSLPPKVQQAWEELVNASSSSPSASSNRNIANPIPPSVLASWPKPNYINPESRRRLLLGCEIPLICLATIAVVGRIWSRGWLVGEEWGLGWDDWLMGFALIPAIALTIVQGVATDYGWGLHMWDMHPNWLIPFRKLAFSAQILFTLSITLTKLSIQIFYLRLSASRTFRFFVHLGIIFTILFMVAFLVTIFTQCIPIQAYWDLSITDGDCINESAANTAHAVLNTVGDFYVYALPIRILWGLNLPKRQRVWVVVVMSLGLIVCAAGALRIWHLQDVLKRTYDSTWDGPILFILTAIECDVSIVCGCIPAWKPIFSRFRKVCFGAVVEDPTLSSVAAANESRRKSSKLDIDNQEIDVVGLADVAHLGELKRTVTGSVKMPEGVGLENADSMTEAGWNGRRDGLKSEGDE